MSPTTRRLLGYFRPHTGKLAVALVLLALHSAVPGLLVLLIERVLDDVLIEQDDRLLRLLPLAVVGLYGANGALAYSRGMLTRRVAWEVVTRLRGQLFEAFVAKQRQQRSDSTGLGLALVRKLVERAGGRIWLEEAVDGTAFRFRWPAEPD